MTAAREHFPPVFATNRDATDGRAGERVADELNRLLSGMRTQLADSPDLAIATAYLNAGGFELLADELEQAPRARLLLGAEPDAVAARPALRAVSPEQIREALAAHDQWLASERDLTGFTREADRAAWRMVEWLRAENADGGRRVEVRRFTKGFLHGKAFITEHPSLPAVLAGSSNFTYAGLARNAELNLGYPSGEHTHLVQEWFNELWRESSPYPLDELYASRWEPHPPHVIFLRMLWELYGGHLDEDDDARRRTELELTGFQREGVARMLRILDEHGGVIVADEVGLGKTFMAGEVINRAAAVSRQRVLVIAPAALKAGMWEPFLEKHDFSRRVKVMSYDEFRNRWRERERDGERDIRRELDEYALVVVDEAHNLRNPNAQRTEAVNALVGGLHPKRLMLLTATPVNNTLFDLHALVSLFIRNDAAFASLGIPSVYKYIQRAEEMDQDRLSHEHLFDLLDQVAVRRTRRFVKRHYQGDVIKTDQGKRVTIEFPQPVLKRLDYDLNQQGLDLVEALVYALDNSEEDARRYDDRQRDPDRLLLARYTSGAWHIEADHEFDYQVSNAGLLRSTLLKRLESSPTALYNTLGKMIDSHRAFLEALRGGAVLAGEALREWTASDDEDLDDFLEGLDDRTAAGADRADDYHVAELRADVESDLELLGRLRKRAGAAADGPDPKLEKLLERLREIAEASRSVSREGTSHGDRRKTLVFSSFADTIQTINDRAAVRIVECDDDDPLADFRGRMSPPVYGAKRGFNPETRARVIAGFAPQTAGGDEDRYDLLFTTDILSEGVNLQQAGRIINYDLPWNPMRVVQRHGRIDRIGSFHRRVFIDCFFPSAHLDRLLGLEKRLRRKLRLAGAAVGTGPVLPGFEEGGAQVFSDIERLHAEDSSFLEERGGAAALSGEEYRRRLRAAVTRNPAQMQDVKALPYGSGSGFVNRRAARSGYVFCIRVGDGDFAPPRFRFVPADDDWRPIIGSDRRPLVNDDTLAALVAADPVDDQTGRELSEQAYDRAFDAWEAAREHVYKEWMFLTDPKNLKPDVPKALREAAELVYEHGEALTPEERDDLLARLNTRPGARIEKAVRELVRAGEDAPARKVRRLRELVREAGLQPARIPDPLPPIAREDIHLVVWTAVQKPLAR